MAQSEPAPGILDIYDRALPQVYGYLLDRCGGNVATAEDLTSETFLAAVATPRPADVSVPWLMGVARHKLVDHWRKRSRDERLLAAVAGGADEPEEPFTLHIERWRTVEVLESLGWQHRAALTLRYLDGLSVPQVADLLDRTVHATEALLVRARTAFRIAYEKGEGDD